MGIWVHWLVPGRVLYIYNTGVITLKDVHGALEIAGNAVVREGQPPVHVVNNQLAIQRLTPDAIQISRLGPGHHVPGLGWAVNVSTNQVASVVLLLVANVARMRVVQRRTVAEALAFLQEQDDTLPPLSVAAALALNVTPDDAG